MSNNSNKALFVTRHVGAVEWAKKQGIEAEHLSHLDPKIIKEGDIVLGTLPVQIAADICARGARYMHLSLNLTPELRGKELSAEDMEKAGASLQEFRVEKL